jgi:hypothetical protein
LEERLGKRDKAGKLRVKNVSKAELQGMNMWVRKAWSTRARRWMKMMPEEVRSRDPWLVSTRRLVREWVKENVAQKGEDPVLWGKWEESDLEEEKLEEACQRPVWTNSQMKRRGEPPKKKSRRDESDAKATKQVDKVRYEGNEMENKSEGVEEKEEMTMRVETKMAVVSRKEMLKGQAERKERLEVRREIRAKKKTEREARKKEMEAKMTKIGKDKSRKQPTLRRWARGEGGLERDGMEERQTGKG